MAKINGTSVLLYSQGKCIAYQKGLSVVINDSLIDATNKESLAWAEQIPGLRDAKIDFTALFGTGLMTDTPTILSAKDLMDYILNRTELLVSVLDTGYPIVGKVNMNSLAFDAPVEGAMGLSGSLKVQGALYSLSGTMINLVTDPDGGTSDYDTLTHTGLAITSAVKSSAGNKKCDSNTISVAITGVYKLAIFLTLNSGQAPTVGIWDNTSAYISNTSLLVAGLNLVTLTSTATDASASLRFSNTSNGNWLCSPIYLFRTT
jgi:predicted secreted protein